MSRWALAVAALAMLAGCDRTSTRTTMQIGFGDAVCSGTVVGKHTILSAAHCFESEASDVMFELPAPPPTEITVDGYRVKILAIVTDDGNDHALVKVNFTFNEHARLSAPPAVGSRVHYWGNPARVNNVYREGYVTSYLYGNMVMDVNGFFGDSGSGIFDAYGRVVGVVSYISPHHTKGLEFKLMGAHPLEFTPLQYSMMGVTPP